MSNDTLKLVTLDNLPNISVALTRSLDGTAVDLSQANTIITIKMRALGQTAVLAQYQGSVLNAPGTDGKMTFGFPGNTLNVAPGLYEFQISVSFNGQTETVFETLKAQIRGAF